MESDMNSRGKHAADRQVLICSICNKEFQRKSNLTCHMRRHGIAVNTGDKKTSRGNNKNYQTHYGCRKCGQSFTFIAGLPSHKCGASKELRIFRCVECKKEFMDVTTLRRHTRYHTKFPENNQEDLRAGSHSGGEDAMIVEPSPTVSRSSEYQDNNCAFGRTSSISSKPCALAEIRPPEQSKSTTQLHVSSGSVYNIESEVSEPSETQRSCDTSGIGQPSKGKETTHDCTSQKGDDSNQNSRAFKRTTQLDNGKYTCKRQKPNYNESLARKTSETASVIQVTYNPEFRNQRAVERIHECTGIRNSPSRQTNSANGVGLAPQPPEAQATINSEANSSVPLCHDSEEAPSHPNISKGPEGLNSREEACSSTPNVRTPEPDGQPPYEQSLINSEASTFVTRCRESEETAGHPSVSKDPEELHFREGACSSTTNGRTPEPDRQTPYEQPLINSEASTFVTRCHDSEEAARHPSVSKDPEELHFREGACSSTTNMKTPESDRQTPYEQPLINSEAGTSVTHCHDSEETDGHPSVSKDVRELSSREGPGRSTPRARAPEPDGKSSVGDVATNQQVSSEGSKGTSQSTSPAPGREIPISATSAPLERVGYVSKNLPEDRCAADRSIMTRLLGSIEIDPANESTSVVPMKFFGHFHTPTSKLSLYYIDKTKTSYLTHTKPPVITESSGFDEGCIRDCITALPQQTLDNTHSGVSRGDAEVAQSSALADGNNGPIPDSVVPEPIGQHTAAANNYYNTVPENSWGHRPLRQMIDMREVPHCSTSHGEQSDSGVVTGLVTRSMGRPMDNRPLHPNNEANQTNYYRHSGVSCHDAHLANSLYPARGSNGPIPNNATPMYLSEPVVLQPACSNRYCNTILQNNCGQPLALLMQTRDGPCCCTSRGQQSIRVAVIGPAGLMHSGPRDLRNKATQTTGHRHSGDSRGNAQAAQSSALAEGTNGRIPDGAAPVCHPEPVGQQAENLTNCSNTVLQQNRGQTPLTSDIETRQLSNSSTSRGHHHNCGAQGIIRPMDYIPVVLNNQMIQRCQHTLPQARVPENLVQQCPT